MIISKNKITLLVETLVVSFVKIFPPEDRIKLTEDRKLKWIISRSWSMSRSFLAVRKLANRFSIQLKANRALVGGIKAVAGTKLQGQST